LLYRTEKQRHRAETAGLTGPKCTAFFEAIAQLHEAAGRPSTRAVARMAGCSHKTVAAVMSGTVWPSPDVVLHITVALGGRRDRLGPLRMAALAEIHAEMDRRMRTWGRRPQ